ncbi:Serpin B9 [Halotydeus destructor]|nr:Serpin B9 [Halotydeus destructor]
MGNIAFSPLAIQTVLNGLLIGSGGPTEVELRNVLGYSQLGLDNDEPQETIRAISAGLFDNVQNDSQLEMASTYLFSNDMKVKNEFQSKLELLDTDVRQVDFFNHADMIQQWVNAWVKWKTRGKVDKLLNEPPSEYTELLILNALYFKAPWEFKFDKFLTKSLPFHNEGRDYDGKLVPFMRRTMTVPFAQVAELDCKVVELPYSGGKNMSAILFLPNDRMGIAKLQKSLTASGLNAVTRKLKSSEVNVEIPRFSIQADLDLADILKQLGVTSLFNKQSADLSKMTVKPVHISKAIHKAKMELTESGTEATAVTAIIVETRSSAPSLLNFIASHPFLFVIRENIYGTILFMARISQL